jgi:hypothetical protein
LSQPGLTFVHPIHGLKVLSVQAIPVVSAIRLSTVFELRMGEAQPLAKVHGRRPQRREASE